MRHRLFGAETQYAATKSPDVTITILETPTTTPTLTLTVDKTTGYVGDSFIFTGNLSYDGTTMPGITITLYNGLLSTGLTGVTDADGNYAITWVADAVGSVSMHTEAQVPIA